MFASIYLNSAGFLVSIAVSLCILQTMRKHLDRFKFIVILSILYILLTVATPIILYLIYDFISFSFMLLSLLGSLASVISVTAFHFVILAIEYEQAERKRFPLYYIPKYPCLPVGKGNRRRSIY